MQLDEPNAPVGLPPMPSANFFLKMATEYKKNALEQTLLERLVIDDGEAALTKASTIVYKYAGQEDQLYDMISDVCVQAVCDISDVGSSKENMTTTRINVDFVVDDLLKSAGSMEVACLPLRMKVLS